MDTTRYLRSVDLTDNVPGEDKSMNKVHNLRKSLLQCNATRPQPSVVVQCDGKRVRKAVHRKTVDYNSAIINSIQNRIYYRKFKASQKIIPSEIYSEKLMMPISYPQTPMNAVTTKFVKQAANKIRCPIFVVTWTAEGRRLITGASSGEFTLWSGLTFNFETILQAHDCGVRAMKWNHSSEWLLTGDQNGYLKYWQTNMHNVKVIQAHKESIRDISFANSDRKFVTCSDDGTLRIWDFFRCTEENVFRGHGSDVKCVDWHPHQALLASGSKDTQQPVKFWDPRSGHLLGTSHAHKNTVMQIRWNKNGNWLLTASRDRLVKLFDIRNLKKEYQVFRGHKKEATSIDWHPRHEGLFASGSADGSLMFWLVGIDKEVGCINEAHDNTIWSLNWHPVGHILASGSNDHSTKFWARSRPGDLMRDKYNLNLLPLGVSEDMIESGEITEETVQRYIQKKIRGSNKSTSLLEKNGLFDDGSDEEGRYDTSNIPGLGVAADNISLKEKSAKPNYRVNERQVDWRVQKAWQAGLPTEHASKHENSQFDQRMPYHQENYHNVPSRIELRSQTQGPNFDSNTYPDDQNGYKKEKYDRYEHQNRQRQRNFRY
ncbi:Polyadenylation factor subunit 2 [Intoshia linei]|uniref:Polyadenylation factor subunit 2 n=1 Tax=Intoshia linei TaxID=1819745 RepID=A0A177B829_9BILA|nr:Polyadenylation factor subunit 2 [Intoshia linei]